jgi:hypothetical protein
MNNQLPIRPKIAREMALKGRGFRRVILAALKGRGFRRATEAQKTNVALATEGMKVIPNKFPQGLKPGIPFSHPMARLKPRPFKTAAGTDFAMRLKPRPFKTATSTATTCTDSVMRLKPRTFNAAIFSRPLLAVCLTVLITTNTFAQDLHPASPVILDRVVAVVNNHAILASDIDQEIQLSVLDPADEGIALTRQRALEQLISRSLIQQQIREEDAQAADSPQAEVDARLKEIRTELPICIRQNCSSDAGWKAFLGAHGLTEERVESYLRYRLQILRFIELRFQPGIRVSPEQIEKYYRETLQPQYSAGDTIPKLEQVAPRIEEILLQQQVNALFDDWLSNLRKQGEIEVLDPALETPEIKTVVPAVAPALESAPAPASAPVSPQGKGGQ